MQTTPTQVTFRGDGLDLAADRWEPAGGIRGAILLLHGGGQTRHSWQRTGIRLATDGWTTYSVDLRGHGDSGWAADGDYSSEAHARDIRSIAAELDTAPVLVGASMGGMAALTAQAEYGLGRALVLVDIAPQAEAAGIDRILEFMESGLPGFDTLDEAVAAVVAYNPQRSRPPRAEGLRKNLRRREGRWYWHWDPKLLEHRDRSASEAADSARRAHRAAAAVTVPTLLIRGAQSDVVSQEGANDLLRAIPGSRQIDVSGAGHMVSGDDNDVLSAGLAEYLDRTLPPGRRPAEPPIG
jgi:pimeloyl-ACP methyl ester carboxylesterase